MAITKNQIDAIGDHIQFLISAMAQPITKAQEDALARLKTSITNAFNSIEGVEVSTEDNSKDEETLKVVSAAMETIKTLKNELDSLKEQVAANNKKAMDSLAEFSHVIEDNSEKIAALESKPTEEDPVVIKVFKGKENLKGVELEYSNAQLPTKKHPTDSGFDGVVCFPDGFQTEEVIQPGETKRIPLGIQCEIPAGYEIQARPRSGKSGERINVALGTIDETYTGIIKANVSNDSKEPYVVKQGDRICQLVVGKVIRAEMKFAEDGEVIRKTDRGANGFGSTGR